MFRRFRAIVMVCVLTAGFTVAASAQLTPPNPTLAPGSPPGSSVPIGKSPWPAYGLGLALGTAGWFAGALTIGRAVNEGCDTEDIGCFLQAALLGGAAVGTPALALGVHLGNGARGNYLLDFLTAAGIWVVGIGPILVSDLAIGEVYAFSMFVAVPLAQLILVDRVDRAAARGTGHASVPSDVPAGGRSFRLAIVTVHGRPGLALQAHF